MHLQLDTQSRAATSLCPLGLKAATKKRPRNEMPETPQGLPYQDVYDWVKAPYDPDDWTNSIHRQHLEHNMRCYEYEEYNRRRHQQRQRERKREKKHKQRHKRWQQQYPPLPARPKSERNPTSERVSFEPNIRIHEFKLKILLRAAKMVTEKDKRRGIDQDRRRAMRSTDRPPEAPHSPITPTPPKIIETQDQEDTQYAVFERPKD